MMNKYKLGDCLLMIRNGASIKQKDGAGGLPITRIETLSNDRFNRDRMGYADIYDASKYAEFILQENDILMSHINSRTYLGRSVQYHKKGDEVIIHGMNLLRLQTNPAILDSIYAYYFFRTTYFKKCIDSIRTDAINQSSFNITDVSQISIYLPELHEQKQIASVLYNLDRKIELNREINSNLEALIRQLYEYWFVQFDFPDTNGKPYKSSGGKMVYNEHLKREIPEGWNICRLEDFIKANNTGDWGADEIADGLFEVGCIRGADILTLTDIPKRYIKSESKLLSEHDIVIEASGGSPIQATGRSAYVTKGVIERNGGKITCSNFCHAFTLKDIHKAPFFYYSWRLLYDNDNMFNYEGKTSGLKNFMTEMFLKNYWIDIPDDLAINFFNKVSMWFAQIDNNIAEMAYLTRQRDELLPLLMNGQITIE